MMLRGALGAALLVAGVSAGCDQPAERESPGTWYGTITHGTPDDAHPQVVGIRRRRSFCPDSPPGIVFCSGIIVADRAVLTAAHCVRTVEDDGLGPTGLEVLLSPDVAAPAPDYRGVVGWVVHPSYDPTSRSNDLAVLALDDPAGLVPWPVASPEVEEEVTLLGYGPTAVGEPTSLRRAGNARVAELDAATMRLAPQPSLSCGGDSGGAVVANRKGGVSLLGVIRSGDTACSSFGIAVRADAAWDSFIASAAAQAETDASSARPAPAADDSTCLASCESDDACPRGMICVDDRVTHRCGYAEVRTGAWGALCASGEACTSGRCAAVGAGRALECRCLSPCATAPAEPLRATGGCALAAGRTASASWIIAFLACVAWLGRARAYGRNRSSDSRTARLWRRSPNSHRAARLPRCREN